MNIRHILVGTDLSQEARNRIPAMADLARALGARITLLHVVQTFEAVPHGSPFSPPLGPPANVKAMEAASAQLEERRSAFGSDIEIDTELVMGGDAAEAITAYAEAHDVDLIAVTTHGRTGFRRLALGSVAEAVIRHSRVPVLVLPLPKD